MFDWHSLHIVVVIKNGNTDKQFICLCKVFLKTKLKFTCLTIKKQVLFKCISLSTDWNIMGIVIILHVSSELFAIICKKRMSKYYNRAGRHKCWTTLKWSINDVLLIDLSDSQSKVAWGHHQKARSQGQPAHGFSALLLGAWVSREQGLK